jgi:hypothetical protein
MTALVGDQRIRPRVTTSVAKVKAAIGTYSAANSNAQWSNRHYISVVVAPGSTAGIFSIRAEPAGVADPGVTGFTKIEIESIDLSTATNLNFEVFGFFDAFAVIIGTAITGGSSPGISVYVNSTLMY